jgi:hypothetical protein
MVENSANVANITELRAHIELANQMLAKNNDPSSDSYKETADSISMYYERILQFKDMRIQTMATEGEEKTVAYQKKFGSLQLTSRRDKGVIAVLLLCCAVCILWCFPWVVDVVVSFVDPYCTTDRFLLVGACVALHLYTSTYK